MYSRAPYAQRAKRHAQHSHKKMVCRNLVLSKQRVTTNIPSPDIRNSAITLRVMGRFSLKTMLSIARIAIIGMNSNSFLNSLELIHSGVFQTSTSNSGRRQATKINSLFHGRGQVCKAEIEKKIINMVDTQYIRNARVPHVSQRE